MMRLLKALLYLIVIAAAALAVYAYFGDFAPAPVETRMPVTLDAN